MWLPRGEAEQSGVGRAGAGPAPESAPDGTTSSPRAWTSSTGQSTGRRAAAVLLLEVGPQAGHVPAGGAGAAASAPAPPVSAASSYRGGSASSSASEAASRTTLAGRAEQGEGGEAGLGGSLQTVEPTHARPPVADAGAVDRRMARAGSRRPPGCPVPGGRQPHPALAVAAEVEGEHGESPSQRLAAEDVVPVPWLPAPWPTMSPGAECPGGAPLRGADRGVAAERRRSAPAPALGGADSGGARRIGRIAAWL